MSVKINENPVVPFSAQPIALSTRFAVTGSGSDPAYLVVDGLDRDEYTVNATGATGELTGDGRSLGFTSLGGDARGAGIVFTYQVSTGRYYSANFGYLDQLAYTPSTSVGDVTDLCFWGTNNLSLANEYGGNAESMMQVDASGYLGSVTVATEPGYSATVPAQATPGSIAAVAETFVGQSWNINGCWVLTSVISAEAGASLPVQSTADIAGQANGEWFVAYDGPAGETGNWQSLVTTGEMVGFETSSGTGHITTIVSGSGSSAMVVDNAAFESAYGQVVNSANDGSPDDITISAPHAASQEFSGVNADTVVIYELDTPVVTTNSTGLTLTPDSADSLGSLFSAADPEGKTVTTYQLYDTDPGGALVVSGTDFNANSTSTAVTVSSLAQVSLQAGAADNTGSIDVRASNGSYWGDWTSLGVTVAGSAPASSPGTPAPSTADNFNWTDIVTDSSGSGAGEAYSGSVAGIQSEYTWSGADSAAIAAQVANVYLVGGPGGDALEAYAGSNVLDGGTGSNFLIGATGADGGTDTFFVDGRGDAPFWDSLVNFHEGDAVTLWGFAPGSTMAWAPNAGAPGYQGATLDVSLANATTGSVTFAGISLSQAQANFVTSSGTSGGVPYLEVQFTA